MRDEHNVSIADQENISLLFRSLIDKKKDLFVVEDFLSSEVTEHLADAIRSFAVSSDHLSLKLGDGVFCPRPYSTVHKHAVAESISSYFSAASAFNQEYAAITDVVLGHLLHLLEKQGVEVRLLKYKDGRSFAALATRLLYAQKNGIDIHCENAFLHQLSPDFRDWMERVIDLENAVSFFVLVQAPQEGGELILFNKEWTDIRILLDTTSYEERHDLNGTLFRNRGITDPAYQSVRLKKGSAVFFRAAQIWHAINKISGNQDRITAGCFFAKGRDGTIYIWA